ncbi:FAD-dependent oxidoreductase [Nocardia sp. NPDC056100]|uniref:FAD-dependent oxidoreductase n=1 Tax=Nocardia sp. NPDC056100 TaxID=3345712 RepID=UPI0035DD16F6
MSRPRIIVAGLGDTGLLTAIHLAKHADVLGISAKPGLVSGQELGMRLSRPGEWARDYWVPFDRFHRLDSVRTVHASLTGLDVQARRVHFTGPDGTPATEPYDALVISTGVSNGFWRRPELQTRDQVAATIAADHARLATADSVIVLGGGAAAVSTAFNVATTWPGKQVDLYFPGDRALPHHHPRVWRTLSARLDRLGVGLHPRHRAIIPDDFACDDITGDPVEWSTGQPKTKAAAVLWTIGRTVPNTTWLPRELLNENGFVNVDPYLRVPTAPGVYAIGDVAATDPLRTSARSRADSLLAHNIRADLTGGEAKPFIPARRRWGSVVGTQRNTLEIFTPTGRALPIPAWSRLQPFIVRRGIYGGIRNQPHDPVDPVK